MSRNLLIIIWSILMQHNLQAQSKWGFENYHYLGLPGTGAVVPMVHLETKNKWYAGLRYNYEADQTLSAFGGKIFETGKKLRGKWTPVCGFSAGNFTGITLAMNAEMEWKQLYFSSQTQQSMATDEISDDFFFTWSEIGYNISRHVFSGLAIQYTIQTSRQNFEPGIVAGIGLKHFSFPCYVFSPLSRNRYFVLGLVYEYRSAKSARS